VVIAEALRDWDLPEEPGQHLPTEFTNVLKEVEKPIDFEKRLNQNMCALHAARARARSEG